jgi:predicted SnoaL-like aldol condensation-catalyzing enzyme
MARWLAGLRLAALCALGGAPVWAGTPPPPILSSGPARTGAEEAADRRIVLAFHRAACGAPAERAAAAGLLATDFRNHNVEQPSGARRYVDYLMTSAAAAQLPGQASAGPLFVITDGDLTMLAAPGAGADPGAHFTANLFEVQNGKITQIWYSGPVGGAGAPPRSDDPRACVASDEPAQAPDRHATRVQRNAALRLVAQFIQDFFVDGDTEAAARVLAPDLISHVPGVPSGRDFAAVAHKHQDRVVAPDPGQELFALADGELVAIGFPVPYASDPGARFAQTVVRVRDGRITEWWYSGYPAGHPRRAW